MANEFLPFALSERANVLRPDVWALDSQRARGFSAGPARSAKMNTVLRQTAFITSVIAQFIADSTGEDVLDNANPQAFADQFRRALGIRAELLIANREFWVAPIAGRDTNPGTQDRPFRTMQAAADYVMRKIDLAGYSVTVHCAPGVYDDGVNVEGIVATNPGQLVFIGDENNPSSTIVSKTQGIGSCFSAGYNAAFTVAGFELRNSTISQDAQGTGIYAWEHGTILARNMHFGTCTNAHVFAWNARVSLSENLRIVGNAPFTVFLDAHANAALRRASITVLGAPSIPVFLQAQGLSQAYCEVLAVLGSLPNTRQVVVTQNSVVTATAALPGGLPPLPGDGGLYFGPGGPNPVAAPLLYQAEPDLGRLGSIHA